MAIIQCPGCGNSISDKAPKCPKCGYVPAASEPVAGEQASKSNFNWGAAGLYPFWGFANGMWWLIFVSFAINWLPLGFNISAGILASIYMGIKGDELARKNKKWRNEQHFNAVQESWKVVGLVFFILNMVSFLILQILAEVESQYYW